MIDTVKSLLTKGFFKSLSYTIAKRDRLAELIPTDYYRQSALLPRVFPYTLGRIFHWLGNLDRVEPFYQAIDVFVSTSEYETFGNSVCEVMACSRPVGAYQSGSVQEVVGDAGLIIETGDLPALTAAVRDCVRRPDLRDQFGRCGRCRVADRFNPAHSLRQLQSLYEDLMGGGRGDLRRAVELRAKTGALPISSSPLNH
jgi:glycosyltransferase involved in cell wall biosynthesis